MKIYEETHNQQGIVNITIEEDVNILKRKMNKSHDKSQEWRNGFREAMNTLWDELARRHAEKKKKDNHDN